MAEKKNESQENVTKMIEKQVKASRVRDMSEDEAYERQYYQNSIIVKVNPETKLIEDIATCFGIEETMEYLMLAPLDFISRTDGIENEKEYKERLWKQVRAFYVAARDALDKRYRL